ncbi:M20 family metallopeptidase [Cupriavidus pampae]|uniref:Acetylornithine deacetylase n=1 Tax=Cupriavidus pampae TaxID=659251 RepID=A0ABN7ZDA3_9BURK|nr:M20 family metallopeptidase [Cupriavidus pampae]CAG9183273.1 Acetylornithine deacetylase [Cupriavidus pampae]
MTRSTALQSALQYLDQGQLFTDLARRVAIRSESDLGADPAALGEYFDAEMVPWLERLGFEVTVSPNPVATGGPFLVARRVEDPAAPTVLTYGHGDVVNGQEASWRKGRGPWALTVDGDRWYGRGTADNKGQHTINLAALEHVLSTRGGKLGYNVLVLMEMGEEAGSPGLREFCEANVAQLRADLFIGCDGPRVAAGRPTLFLGSRGMVNFTLSMRARERAYHSGNWGGVISNPASVLANALATIVDAQGRMLVSELLPPAIPDAVRAALADIELGGGKDDPPFTTGWGEPDLTAAERLVAWNTIEVLALGAGSPQRPVNAIPPAAVAHCQLRFVVGTRWQELESILRRHLDAHGFGEVEVSITMSGAATRLDVDHPWVQWASDSIEASTGTAPAVLPNLAGTLPNDVFADVLKLPTIWVPHSYPACAQHGPDEHMLTDVTREGLRIMAGLYWDLGERGTLPAGVGV